MFRENIRKIIKDNKNITNSLLGFFIKLHNYSYRKISEYAGYLNNDIHPKHEITKYHQFFLGHIETGDNLLDLGCGSGFLSFDLASKANKVTGIDIKDYNIKEANNNYKKDNLFFLTGDATKYEFSGKFDKIILSNVLEHIEKRTDFLAKLKNISDTILLRVPMENRDWLAVYKKQNGYEYRLDNTHYIEYTLDTLRSELEQVGWRLDNYQINWGELWGVVKIKN